MFAFHSDHVPRVSGSHKEYDLHVRSWHLSALWRQNERVPHLPQGHRTSHPTLLECRAMATSLFSSHRACCCSHKHLSCIRKALCVHAKLRVISVASSLFYHLDSIFVQLTSVFCLLGLCSARRGRILLNYFLSFCSCKCPLFFCHEQFSNTYKTWTDTVRVCCFIFYYVRVLCSYILMQTIESTVSV